jgi:hypothetical protein
VEENYIPDESEVSMAEADQAADIHEDEFDRREDETFTGPGYPSPKPRDSIFTFFKQLLHISDTTRVANINPKNELGMLQFSVRTNQYLALVGDIFGDRDFSDYWMAQSQIMTSSSMSKQGWLPELVVSQKKFTSRSVRPIRTEKKGFLGFGKNEAPGTPPGP